jgi:hypothetical protein
LGCKCGNTVQFFGLIHVKDLHVEQIPFITNQYEKSLLARVWVFIVKFIL